MQIKNRQQLLVIVAICAVGLFAGDKLIVEPLIGAWTARAQRIADLSKRVKDGERVLKWEADLRTRWDRMRLNTLSNNTSSAEQKVFRALDSWEADSRVIITARTPQWKHDSDDYMTYECRLDATGNLPSLSRFLYNVESDPMALRLESIELGAKDKDGQLVNMGLQFSGLALNPQPQ
ncbi:exported hypothetical protein [Verrucomicrobia bacterium]|nr:exported hypothetical protein [Verrucomicrobiota bacterium]